MDCLFGIKGKDFVVLAADGTVEFSIVKFKDTEDKIAVVDGDKLFASAGAQGERTQLMDHLEKNIHLYSIRNGFKRTTQAAANFTRGELARFLRENPFQVNLLIGGYDAVKGPSLYYIDHLAAMQEVSRGAHGYGAYFVLGLLDRYWKPDLTEAEAVEIVGKCIQEIRLRFLMHRNNFVVKVVDKDGTRLVEAN
jgi:20S proteasome subunit beta 4